MSYITLPLKPRGNNSVYVPALSATLYKTYKEAEEEATSLAQKHGKPYYVLHVESVVETNVVVSVNKFQGE